jgi:NAD(P)-dependent dehydrogenase (short-subunit alcohol dehydrogenase family)
MEMRSLLKDEVVVVTGAAQDNRRAIAPGMAGAGAKVVVADVNWDGVKAVTHEIESLGSAALPHLTLKTETQARVLPKRRRPARTYLSPG